MVRKATEADFAAIEAVIRKFPDTLMQVHLPRPDEFFVAEENGEIVGCCALEMYSQRLAEIRSLAVLPEHQGRGIAKELVEACLALAKEKQIYEVLSVTGAPEFFEKFGFGTFNKEKYALLKILQ